jgi:hypothetical protein
MMASAQTIVWGTEPAHQEFEIIRCARNEVHSQCTWVIDTVSNVEPHFEWAHLHQIDLRDHSKGVLDI